MRYALSIKCCDFDPSLCGKTTLERLNLPRAAHNSPHFDLGRFAQKLFTNCPKAICSKVCAERPCFHSHFASCPCTQGHSVPMHARRDVNMGRALEIGLTWAVNQSEIRPKSYREHFECL